MEGKLRIHFILDSPFGYVAIGRDNWLYNVALKLQEKGCEITIHTQKTGKKRMHWAHRNNLISHISAIFKNKFGTVLIACANHQQNQGQNQS